MIGKQGRNLFSAVALRKGWHNLSHPPTEMENDLRVLASQAWDKVFVATASVISTVIR